MVCKSLLISFEFQLDHGAIAVSLQAEVDIHDEASAQGPRHYLSMLVLQFGIQRTLRPVVELAPRRRPDIQDQVSPAGS